MEGRDSHDDDDDVSGYLPPDQRWWRHPSELPPAVGPSGSRPAALLPAAGSSRTALVLAALIGTAGAVLVAYIAHLAHPATDDVATRSSVRVGVTASSLVAVTTTLAPTSSAVQGIAQLVFPAGSEKRTSPAAVLGRDRLVTSAKAVAGVTQVTAVMSDGSQQQAKVAWVDRSSGTAVLDIDEPTPTLASGQAATLSKGDEVVAAGTNTKGKVDQVGVQAIADDGTRMSHLLRVKMDAPVADGAVLLDRSGRAVGICIGHVQSDGTAMLAAPIELARAATGATPDPDGSRRFAWLGITGRTATPVDLAPPTTVATTTTTPETVASSAPTTAASETTTTIEAVTATPESGPASTDVTTTTTTSTTTVPTSSTSTVPPSTTVATTTANMPSGGALIVAVEDGSPAALAGLEVGDVVVAVDDVPVSSMNALVLLVRERQVGGTVHLTVERAGQLLELSAVLGDRPGN